MRAASVLQKILGSALSRLHTFQSRCLLLAVEALSSGRRLTLIDLARHWPGAERVRTPLKRIDRLLSNHAVHGSRGDLYGAMALWLLRSRQPLIVVDWSDLKRDGRLCLLRAAVPVGGRCLTLLDQVVAQSEQANGRVHKAFLNRLQQLVPQGIRPIVVTDAGFRSDWFAQVEELGWDWVGRLRGGIKVQLNGESNWTLCTQLYERQTRRACDLGPALIAKTTSFPCRLLLNATPVFKGRHSLTRAGKPSADRRHLKAARSHREPWLLACSFGLKNLTANQIMKCYRRRMEIEESFRDLKSHKYGQGFEDSQSRSALRIEMLLLIHALTTFAAWLVGCAIITEKLDRFIAPNSCRSRKYSAIRIGWECWRYKRPKLSLELIEAVLL